MSLNSYSFHLQHCLLFPVQTAKLNNWNFNTQLSPKAKNRKIKYSFKWQWKKPIIYLSSLSSKFKSHPDFLLQHWTRVFSFISKFLKLWNIISSNVFISNNSISTGPTNSNAPWDWLHRDNRLSIWWKYDLLYWEKSLVLHFFQL